MGEEDAFWAAIGAAPDDQLPRLVFADWLDERPGMVKCGCDDGSIDSGGTTPWGEWISLKCGECNGTRYVSSGSAELAAALRATADRVPWSSENSMHYWHRCGDPDCRCSLPEDIFDRLIGDGEDLCIQPQNWFWPTAQAAIRALCRAWIAVEAEKEAKLLQTQTTGDAGITVDSVNC